MLRMVYLAAALSVLGALGLVGGKSGGVTGPTDREAAADVARMLKDFQEDRKRPPAGLHELADADATHPLGYGAVSSQQFVVFWKVPVSAGAADAVLAYHKDVPG